MCSSVTSGFTCLYFASSSTSFFPFLRRVLLLNLDLTFWTDWLAKKPQGSVGVSATHHWVYGYAPPPLALKWMLVIQTPGTYTMITVPTEHLPAQSMVLTRGFSSFIFKEFIKYIQSWLSSLFLYTSSKNLSFHVTCPPAVEQLSLKHLIFLTLILKPGGAHKHSGRLSPLGV